MSDIYTAYQCRVCKKEFILLSDDVEQVVNGRYIACPYCNSKKIGKEKTTSDLRECMKERSYKKEHGVIKQIR